jgi:hypothetical protein
VAKATIEFYAASFNGVEDLVFTNQYGTLLKRRIGVFGVRWADDADSEVGLDRVGETEAVSDYGTIFEGAEFEVDFIFGGGGGAADFKGADVAVCFLVN